MGGGTTPVDNRRQVSRRLDRLRRLDRVEEVEQEEVKVRDVIRLMEHDGWVLSRTRGSHRQYKHPTKPGLVTIPGKPGRDLPVGLQRSILRQAGLLEDRRRPGGAVP
jgi:predicted RNA binding protein YcfA (HicA-like mRNA interferase family)